MDIKKYDTEQLTFNLHKLAAPGDPTYQLVVKYDCRWILVACLVVKKKLKNYQKFEFAKEIKDERSKIRNNHHQQRSVEVSTKQEQDNARLYSIKR